MDVDVAAALAAGDLSLDAADAIRAGLGTPAGEVPADALALAARTLVLLAATLTVEALAVRAREERLALDLALVIEREKALRDRRSLTLHRQADGMTRLTALLDPESAAVITSVLDGSPPLVAAARDSSMKQRRLRPRPSSTIRAPRSSSRSMRSCSSSRSAPRCVRSSWWGGAVPTVQVLVTAGDLSTGAGLGFIQGQTEPVSIATVRRHICQNGLQPVIFDSEGTPLDLGQSGSSSPASGGAMAARDGGCMFLDCERPPSWCEAHHTDHWERDHGRRMWMPASCSASTITSCSMTTDGRSTVSADGSG